MAACYKADLQTAVAIVVCGKFYCPTVCMCVLIDPPGADRMAGTKLHSLIYLLPSLSSEVRPAGGRDWVISWTTAASLIGNRFNLPSTTANNQHHMQKLTVSFFRDVSNCVTFWTTCTVNLNVHALVLARLLQVGSWMASVENQMLNSSGAGEETGLPAFLTTGATICSGSLPSADWQAYGDHHHTENKLEITQLDICQVKYQPSHAATPQEKATAKGTRY